MDVLTNARMKKIDEETIARFCPGLELMERAGRKVSDYILGCFPEKGFKAAVFVGPGNNGGDALVVARHLHGSGVVHSHHGAQHGPQLGPRPRMLDIGSGGGSPAIPLKLSMPTLNLTMVESKTRKSAFLREAIRQLNLADSTVETARAEDLLTRSELVESQDLVTIRAVRIEQKLLTKIQAFLRLGGRILLFRSTGGTEAPPLVTPPLVYEATWTLVESLRSRLVILRKML